MPTTLKATEETLSELDFMLKIDQVVFLLHVSLLIRQNTLHF